MKTALVYVSKYGATEKCAGKLAEAARHEVVLFDLGKIKDLDLEEFDNLVLGGPIYAGKLPKKMRTFIDNNSSLFINKRIFLFISCLFEGERAEKELLEAFPPWLIEKAEAETTVGGEVILSKLKFADRFITKSMIKLENDVKKIDEAAIRSLAKEIDAAEK